MATALDKPVDVALPAAEPRELLRRFAPTGTWRARLRRGVLLAWRAIGARRVGLVKRAIDVVVSGGLLAVTAPVWAPWLLLVRLRGVSLLAEPRVGRGMRRFSIYRFPTGRSRLAAALRALQLDRLPLFASVLIGEMTLVGPRALQPSELDLRDRLARYRLGDRPGLISLWWVRRRANIAYESELETDLQQLDTASIRSDFGIALRALPAALYGETALDAPRRISIQGIAVDNFTMREAVEEIVDRLDDLSAQHQVCFVNADCVNIAHRDPAYLDVLRRSDLTLADGIGMKLAGRLLGNPIRENVNGTDLLPRLCGRLAGSGKRIFLLGAQPGVADAAWGWIERNYPHVTVCGARDGYFTADQEAEVARQIAAAGTDLLLVALGAPRQDVWIQDHLPATGARVAIGVGGLFDFYSGRVPRAPQWVRELGVEWVYRFLQEPRRLWRRYVLGNGLFVLRVVRQRLTARGD